MSEKNKRESDSKAVPFFARYLEGQLEDLSEAEMKAVGGRRGLITTKKYPSDSEDGVGIKPIWGDIPVRRRYPSDREDSGVGDMPVTLKYPSDHEDSGGGDLVVTLKYPSDHEDSIG
ncbi:MAG: microviridin/marinostatin family tricyclic proteinase inhibitor [Limnospira sp.]